MANAFRLGFPAADQVADGAPNRLLAPG
jgi:hypothetical protein